MQLEKIVRIILIVGILILIPFIFYTANRRDPPHMILSYLNEEQIMGNYPTEVQIGDNITLFFVVESYWSETTNIQIRHITGKNTTVTLSSQCSINGTQIQNFTHLIKVSEEWGPNEVNSSFTEPLGSNEHYIIIFELWIDLGSGWEFLEDQIVFNRLNVTYS